MLDPSFAKRSRRSDSRRLRRQAEATGALSSASTSARSCRPGSGTSRKTLASNGRAVGVRRVRLTAARRARARLPCLSASSRARRSSASSPVPGLQLAELQVDFRDPPLLLGLRSGCKCCLQHPAGRVDVACGEMDISQKGQIVGPTRNGLHRRQLFESLLDPLGTVRRGCSHGPRRQDAVPGPVVGELVAGAQLVGDHRMLQHARVLTEELREDSGVGVSDRT